MLLGNTERINVRESLSHYDDDPAHKLSPMQDGISRIKFLTTDELKRLISVIKDKRDKAIFLTAYRRGLRASEIGLLQINDVDFKGLRITIRRVIGHLSGLKALDCADSIPKSETPKTQLSGDSRVLCPKITGILAIPVHNSIALRPVVLEARGDNRGLLLDVCRWSK
jgi:integrase